MENNLNKLDKVLKEMELLAEKELSPIVGPEKGKIIIKIIDEIKPKYILEIGTLFGYSAILMGNKLGEDARLITIEVDREEAEIARGNIERAGITADVDILVGNALDILPKLNNKFDLVFLDAVKEDNINYLRLIEKKLHKGSVLIADNADMMAYQMEDYLDYVRSSGKYESKYIAVADDGLEISTKL